MRGFKRQMRMAQGAALLALLFFIAFFVVPSGGTAAYRQLSESNPIGQAVARAMPSAFAERAAAEDAEVAAKDHKRTAHRQVGDASPAVTLASLTCSPEKIEASITIDETAVPAHLSRSALVSMTVTDLTVETARLKTQSLRLADPVDAIASSSRPHTLPASQASEITTSVTLTADKLAGRSCEDLAVTIAAERTPAKPGVNATSMKAWKASDSTEFFSH